MNLKRGEGGDTAIRASTFAKYFPDEEFVDYSFNVDDEEEELLVNDLLGHARDQESSGGVL